MPHQRAYYASPRALRQALNRVEGDWTRLLTPAQLATALPGESWGGHTTVGSWLADGAHTQDVCSIFWVVQAPQTS